MKEKPKRKNTYRRWWAFRGLIVALIVFLCVVGYSLTLKSEGEYLYYESDRNVWRMSTLPDTTPELIGSIDEFRDVFLNGIIRNDISFYRSRDQKQIRRRNLISGDDSLMIDCASMAEGGKCLSFSLSADGNLLVYNFVYSTSESPFDLFEVRLLNIGQNTNRLLFELSTSFYQLHWINDHQFEFMVDRELWHYDINTDDLRQIEVDLNRIKSLDSSYYVVWTVDNVISPVRTHYDYFLHNSDGSPVDNYHVIPFNEAQPDNVICWRPDDRGFVYHHLHTEIAQYANDLYYYDVKENQSHHLLDLGLRNDFRGVSWSPQGRYLLIFTENQLLLYDMQTDSTRNLDVESNSLLGWDSRVGCRGFPYYVFRG